MNNNPIERRYDSGEFIVSVSLLGLTVILSWWAPAFGAFSVSGLSAAYTISRTLRKSNRPNLLYPSGQTSEFKILGGSVGYVILLLAHGLQPSLAIASLSLAGVPFIVCRGYLKQAEKKLIMRQNITP